MAAGLAARYDIESKSDDQMRKGLKDSSSVYRFDAPIVALVLAPGYSCWRFVEKLAAWLPESSVSVGLHNVQWKWQRTLATIL